MSGSQIQIEGLKEVRQALKRLGDEAKSGLKELHSDAAAVVASEAQSFVPRRSGRLADSIRSTGQAGGGVVRAGKAAVPYAGPIHFGWVKHNIEPQPFLYRAADARADEVTDAFHKGINRLAETAGLNITGDTE